MSESATIVNWKVEEAVASVCNVSSERATRVMRLLREGSTVPFIARYRKECTGNLPASTLHKIKETMEECTMVIEKIDKSMKSIAGSGLLTGNIKEALSSCKSMEDVEFVTEPFRSTTGPRTLAGRARKAGLEPLALRILLEPSEFSLEQCVPPEALAEFGDLASVEEAIRNIIADIFAKDIALLDGAERLNCPSTTIVQSRLKRAFIKPDPKKKVDDHIRVMKEKLSPYYHFEKPLQKLLAHQVMAINRGFKNKILKVSFQFPDSLQHVFIDLCNKRYLQNMCVTFKPFVTDCALDAYKRLVQPHLIRKIKSNLTKEAQLQALDVFESNLRQLVMTGPLRGVPILGVDPGHYHGTKVAVIDTNSQLLDTAVIHLSRTQDMYLQGRHAFLQLVLKHRVEHIAIGDGCGNELASKLVSAMIAAKAFGELHVRFAIVRECGASVWSVTEESSKEFPLLDPNLRSAVSIARRLQDPMAEYVKMDPKSLGLGMYQHDLAPSALLNKVNIVLQDCISFVGVDINHAPPHVLQHVSGLGPSKAKAIVLHREKHGHFRNRRQLLNVKGVGEAVFTQAAGFIRIKGVGYDGASSTRNFSYEPDGRVVVSKRNVRHKTNKRDAMMTDVSNIPRTQRKARNIDENEINPLDQTSIHPESYDIAERIIQMLNLEPSDVGTTAMQQATKTFMGNTDYLQILSQFMTEFCGLETLQDIIINLSRPLEFDERNNFCASMLRQSYGSSFDLKVDQTVNGFVTNVTTFGIFVDIGVERSAFCHRRIDGLVLGDNVEGVITFIDNTKLSIDRLRKIPRF